MDIETRIARLRGPIISAGAAIDAARVLANITGVPHRIWLDLENKRWHARPRTDARDVASWDRAGGDYFPGEERANITTDPELEPELALERGILPNAQKHESYCDCGECCYRRKHPQLAPRA